MNIKCKCGVKYEIDETYYGKSFQCTNCNSLVDVPNIGNTPPIAIPTLKEVTHKKSKVDLMITTSLLPIGFIVALTPIHWVGVIIIMVGFILLPFSLFKFFKK